MEDWLQQLWKKPQFKSIAFLLLFLLIVYAALNQVALMSDVGFSDEIKSYRWWILLAVGIVGFVGVFGYHYFQLYRERKTLLSQLEKLSNDNDDLIQQKESLLRLMEAYKSEAQEDILNRLRQLAIFSIRQQEWKARGARVERFRIEESRINGDESEIDIVERITVLVSIGAKDDVSRGMRFIIQDPTDNQKYGTIVVRECYESGAACSVVEMTHPAFWGDIREALELKGGKVGIVSASANILVPQTPFKELTLESAKQLLDWLQKLEGVEL
jgi:hypothetical protein